MKPITLRVVSDEGVEATICSDGSQGSVDDFYSVVSVSGFMDEKKVYGIDPIQSFALGLSLIAQLTEKKRIGDDDDADPINGITWKIEVVEA